MVGDATRFNTEGAVPTNTTQRNILRGEDENDWQAVEDIRLFAQMAALLHDLGKASIAFQQRLAGKLSERNLYRHEWVSLRLFQAYVGEDDDEGWLTRMADADHFDEHAWLAQGRYIRDGLDINPRDPSDLHYPFRKLPPLAAAIAWLVVTHHRLPTVPVVKEGAQQHLGARPLGFDWAWLENPLSKVTHSWNEKYQPAEAAQIERYWRPAGKLPTSGPKWRAQAARIAKRLLDRQCHRAADWLDNPSTMHLARLCLMLADHHYSSLAPRSSACIEGDEHDTLYANTAQDGSPKQSLSEHLLGVARDAGLIAHALPNFERHLPRLANHRGLRKRSANPAFSWQDKAADAAASIREAARTRGAFIVNMASTGCGKTLGNARMLYMLADPAQGLRASYALGLRALTMQTGRVYRYDLHLGEDELAIHAGGSASRTLFELHERDAESSGSASTQALVIEDSHVYYEGNTTHHPLLSRALADDDIRRLISAPMLVCTVDHLVPATESLRSGRQIAPMLRLMSSDLILDELDDYDLKDLPALTRLVHWAGMLGTRVVISSATLPAALVEGMFLAYQAGRRQYRRASAMHANSAAADQDIPCIWTDEFKTQVAHCGSRETFASQHEQFVDKRVMKLSAEPPLRRGELRPLDITARKPEQIRVQFASLVRDACLQLHAEHAGVDRLSGKRVSFGMIRMANIDPLIDVAKALYESGAPEGTRIHLCVYHARFPLAQRSVIEAMLDAALNRRGDEQDVYKQASIRKMLDASSDRDHLFVVLASPVCEVGRDWDADWAIVEPSSMRSLIQLAGRIQRHRRREPKTPNIFVFDTNLRYLEHRGQDKPAYVRPGFEKDGAPSSHQFRLATPWLHDLLDPQDWQIVNAAPRIRPRAEALSKKKRNLIALEHARICFSMLPREKAGAPSDREPGPPALEWEESAPSWQHPCAALSGVLQQIQPFRDDPVSRTPLVLLPDDDEERLDLYVIEKDASGQPQYVKDDSRRHRMALTLGPGIAPWGDFDLFEVLTKLAQELGTTLMETARKHASLEVPRSEQGWGWHPWLGFRGGP